MNLGIMLLTYVLLGTFPSNLPSEDALIFSMKVMNKQARKSFKGYKSEERLKYYSDTQLKEIAEGVLNCAKLQFPRSQRRLAIWILGVLQQQSRLHYDAKGDLVNGKFTSWGISQIRCGFSSPYCKHPPSKKMMKRLMNITENIFLLCNWQRKKEKRCRTHIHRYRRTKIKTKLYLKCKWNKKTTGVLSTVNRSSNTKRFMKKIRCGLRTYRDFLKVRSYHLSKIDAQLLYGRYISLCD